MDDQRDLEKIAGELYALRPDEFAALRDERVRTARAEGRPALARELNRLRRPTQSAWLINLLWRDQRDIMQQLFQLADELGQAQARASGPDLHRLTAQRRELESALVRRARELAEDAGVSVSASMEREAQETLAAALARPEVAEEVRGSGLRKAVGELVTCPFCLDQWVATVGIFGLIMAPRPTRAAASTFAVLAGADILQFAYAKLEEN